MPGSKQPCPNSAACWSPAIPAIGIEVPSSCACATTAQESTTVGRQAGGTPNMSSISASHWPVCRSSSSVRLALETSVRCAAPPVSFQISQLSTVPNASSPACARVRAPGTFSRSHASLVAEK